MIPELNGKLNGTAIRAPIPTGSLVDLVVNVRKETSIAEVNSAFEAAAAEDELQSVLAYTEDPIVSSDIVQSPYSAIFDSGLTMVNGGTLVKALAWYDNEWGYSNRVVDLTQRVL